MTSFSKVVLVCTALAVLVPVLAMPPAPGVKITRAELDERTRLGIDVVRRPVRGAGTRAIVNSPGDVTPLVIGTIPFPVVAIKYSDFANTYTVANFQNMLFGTWSSGSARDYYHEVSYNQFHMTGTVVGWYTAANVKSYYGYSNGFTRAAMLVKEAAAASDSAVNYANYDVDGDGYVDAFTCIHAGYGTEESGSGTDIWSHAWSFSGAGIGAYTTNDPRPGFPGQYIRIDDYTTDPERSSYSNNGTMVSIGVYCHEWGHALGLPDLYDTDGGGSGLGNWALMASGSWGANGSSPYYPAHLDPWCKMELGWLCPTAVRSRNLYSIPQVETNSKAYWLMARNRTFQEYFLVENRRKTGFDTLMYSSGLLIYHIDDSVIARRRGNNQINAGGTGWKYGVALEQADGLDELYSGADRGDANDPWPGGLGRTTFDSTSTTPNSRTNYPSSSTLITGCLVKNIPASASTVQCTLGSGLVGAFTGGPDSRGYSWIDSDTAGGPAYNWVDITGTGTLLGSGDDARWSVALPYTFRFYNTNYTSVWVSTNGWLSFGADPGTNAPSNTAVPAAAAPNRAVYAFWDDLNLVPSDSGYVYYQTGGTTPNCSTVVMWKNARVKGSVNYNQATFAAVLYEGGRIVLRYRDAAVTDTNYTWGRSATVGIEDENGTVGLQYLYNGAPRGNLLANERAVRFAPSGAAVRDVGATVVVAPAGTIDSGTAVTPACTVYNYGTTTESYNVRCRIGAFYSQTAAVTNHAPGAKLYVSFPAYSTWPRGTFSVACSTELATDATPANDKASGSVTVRVLDAQALSIVAPTGTVDSGTVVAPQASVRNNGSASATFNVRFDIQGGYSNTQTVLNLASGATTTVTFTSWTATQRGALTTRCTTMLAGDLVQPNNLVTGSVTVRVRDVGATRVTAPAGTIDSGTVVTPSCSVYNYGSTTETYNVRCKVGAFYNQTATVTNHAPGTRVYVTFTNWTAVQRGTNAVSCSTELGGDAVQANNKASGTVTVRVPDVGCRALLAPSGTVDSGTVVTPACTVYNYGSAAATYTVRMKVGAGYNQTAAVTDHAAGTALYVAFPNWSASLPRGSYAVSCSTELTGDINNPNDKQTGSVTIGVDDAASVALLAPSGTVDSGAVVTPACTVANYGTAAASYTVRMKVGAGYNQTASVTNQAPGARTYLTFPNWTATVRGANAVSCSTELSGDLVQANNKLNGAVTVRVRDVGCVQVIQPAGTIDSGTAVAPSCTVYNYGTTAESYTVRCRVGIFYNQTATVTSHAPGVRVAVSFPAYSTWPRGTHAVSCSTEFPADARTANDKATGTVTVRVPDVGCRALLSPSGTVDSGTSVVPTCTVYNYGSGAATYTVRMKVGTGYNQTAAVTGHTAGAALYVTFPNWTASLPRGSYPVSCSTELAGDLNSSNDRRTGSVVIGVADAATIGIVTPSGTVDSGSTITPSCSVANFGTAAASFSVRMKIGSTYNLAAPVTNLAPGARQLVTLPNWTATGRGLNAVSCSTELDGDLVSANDERTGSVDVRVRDVGCAVLVAPTGQVDSGAVVTPACTVVNYGTAAEAYMVRMRIGAGYDQTASLSSHAPGARVLVTFPAWNAAPRGAVTASCSTELALDMRPANDRQTSRVDVVVRDVACTRLVAPAGTLDSGTTVTPACTVRNLGTAAESYTVRMRIGSSYDQVAAVTNHTTGTALYVTFPDWLVDRPRGSVAVTCSTELARDMQPANDRQTGLVDVQVHDVGCARVTAPRGVVDLDSLVAPACTVRNYGSVTETYVVRMRIGSAYSQPVAVTGHAPGTDQYVTFPAWTAGPVGTVAVTCSTELSTDPMPANDRLSDSVRVRAGEDVGVVSIDAPSGRLDTSTVVVPRATVRNFGQLPARCDVFFRVRTGAGDIYTSTRTVTALAPDSSATVLFDTLAKPHLPGAYATRCSSGMAGDANPANDVRSDSFRFTAPPRTPGWTARTAMPGLPSGKPAKDGGWLTYDAATGLIYAAKGNKTTDFYSYNPRTDSWRQLAPIPMGTEAKPPSKGAVGCASGTGVIFATKGNNTSGFYKYVAARDSWYALTGVPLGVSGKKVKGGTDLAYIDAGSGAGHVYCLKGYNNEFYRYNSPADSWSALATAPAARYDKGSWLAHVPAAEARVLGTGSETDDRGPLAEAVDAGGSVYCHQAKYHGFGAFNLATQTWSSGLTGMPFIGRSGRSKKSKDGGAAAVLGSAIYAFKGGGTQEFWHYLPGPGTWSELETLPQVAPGGASKKKVKAGADLTASLFDVSLYGLKGNKTLELWRYVPALAAVPELAGAKQGVMSVAEPEMSGALRVSPNPLVSDRALVRLGSALARRPGGLISASVIDAAGRCVLSASVDAERPSFALDLESLHAGVYLLRIEAGDRVLTQKLVIQR